MENLQNTIRNKLSINISYKLEIKTNNAWRSLYLSSLWKMGHHALAQEATSPYWFEWCGAKLNTHGIWLAEKMRERDEWLENIGFSRHSYGQSNGRQRMNVLRVTPTPIFIDFSQVLGFLAIGEGF